MRPRPTSLASATALALLPLLTPLTAGPATAGPATASTGAPAAAAPARAGGGHHVAAAVAVEWQRLAVATVYAAPAPPPPVGTLYLAFASLAVHDAVTTSMRAPRSSEVAAVAVAAHDVLHHYFPAARPVLDARLAQTLARVPDTRKQEKGARKGRKAARRMIVSRVGDGRDASVVYARPDVPGVWQPATGAAMTAAWLGFVDPLVLDRPVTLDGPDGLTSAAYAADWDEVRRLGSETSTERTAEQTAVARFFTANPVTTYRDALFRHLDQHPRGLRATTRLMARLDAATADTFIQAWRLKYDTAFWRPVEAIREAATDGNDATTADGGWTALVPHPSYADYTSGHAAATAPFAQVVRTMLGDGVALTLVGATSTRVYPTLTQLERDALEARIWSGLHFRDAMDDGYLLGHLTADRVVDRLR